MKTETYNGWTNYETWNVNLWMDNEQGSQEYYRETAERTFKHAKPGGTFTKSERATLDFADWLKEEYETASQDILEKSNAQASVWADLLGAALSEVNWHEIAKHYIDEAEQALG